MQSYGADSFVSFFEHAYSVLCVVLVISFAQILAPLNLRLTTKNFVVVNFAQLMFVRTLSVSKRIKLASLQIRSEPDSFSS